MKNDNKVLGFFLGAFCIFVWGTTFVCTKYLLEDFSSFEILFFRYIAAYIILWIMHPKALKLKDKKEELTFIMAGLTGVVIYQLMENISINFTNASNVSIIVSICPMFTAITARIFLKEKSLTPAFIIGFIIAITGVTLVSFNGVIEFNLNPLGDFLALGAGISWGFYSLFVSKMNGYDYNPVAKIRRAFFWALVFMVPVALAGGFIPGLKGTPIQVDFDAAVNAVRFSSWINILSLLFLGIVASALCFVFWNYACSSLGTVSASIGVYLIPAVTFVFAWIFLGERWSFMGLAGTVCTLVGVGVSSLKFKGKDTD